MLERDADELTKELIDHFRDHPPEAREPDEFMTTPPDANVKFPKQDKAPPIEGWRYIGTFAITGPIRLGDRSYLVAKKPKTREQKLKDWVVMDIKKGNWHAYQHDVDGEEAIFVLHQKSKLTPDAVSSEQLKVWIDGGDIGIIDEVHKDLPEVAENLRWEMSPAGTAFPWGAVFYTAVGDGAYRVMVDGGKSVGAMRIQL